MKTRIATYTTIICLVTLLLPATSFSQKAKTSIDEKYNWKNEDKIDIQFIDVKKSSSTLLMSFAGAITEGSLEVNAYNPSGEKVPGFVLITNDGSKQGISVSVSTGDDEESSKTVTSTNSSGVSTSTVTTTSTSSTSSSSTSEISEGDTSGSYSSKSSYEYSSSNSNSHGAKGVVSKVLTDPAHGKWKLVITAKNVTGKLDVEIDQE